MEQKPTKRAIAPWLLVIFIIMFLAGGGYLVWHYFGSKSANGWTIYKNKSFNYSISIPKDWSIIPPVVVDGQLSKKEQERVIDFADSQKKNQLKIIVCETCKKGNQYGTLKNYASDIGPPDRESLITNQEQFQIGQVNGYKETVFNSFYTPNNTTEYFAESNDFYIRFINLNSLNEVEEILATFKLD